MAVVSGTQRMRGFAMWPFRRKPIQKLYVMYCPATSLTKIGIGYDPERRRRILENQGGNIIQLVGAWQVDNAREIEKFLHKRLASFRREGEWFDVTPTVREFILHTLNNMPSQRG